MTDIKCTSLQEPSLMKYFLDPVPNGYIVTSITSTILGMFGCKEVSSSFVVTIDNGVVGSSSDIPPGSFYFSYYCYCYCYWNNSSEYYFLFIFDNFFIIEFIIER